MGNNDEIFGETLNSFRRFAFRRLSSRRLSFRIPYRWFQEETVLYQQNKEGKGVRYEEPTMVESKGWICFFERI